jgi:tetratricopeptide (TPR) repeat protein
VSPLKALALALALAACSGTHSHRRTLGAGQRIRERDPIKPAAAKEFEAAMRAIRLGGPEADQTARTRLRGALKIDGSIWEAWYDLGVIAFREGDDDEAIDDLGKALAQNPGHVATLMARAETYRRAGKAKDARADYQAALKGMAQDDPNRPDIESRLASLLRDAGAYDDAVEVLREAVRVSGTSARIYVELGQIYIAQKRLDLAQLVLAKAVEIDPKDPQAYNALALLALKQGKAQEAFGLFDQAASLDASYLDARFNKASVLLDAGDYARARDELAAIVKQEPDDYAAQVALGVAHRGLKEFPRALAVWNRVIAKAPRRSAPRADALWNVAILKLDFMEDMAGGKAALERYMQEAPSGHAKRQDAENKCKEVKCR